MKRIITLLLLLCSFTLFSQTIYYVKPSGNDNNNGTSWATAFKTLQKGINTIIAGQVWVAAGTYYPDEGPFQGDNNRGSYFTLKAGVALYGGFAGTETALAQRNWKTNVSILSGDINQDNGFAGNSYNILRCVNVDSTAVIDGFTITGGNANNANNIPQARGGGLNNSNSSPVINNCIFSGNISGIGDAGGGAIYNYNSSPSINNCAFTGNWVANDGAAIKNDYYSRPAITHCSFSGNTAANGGGGIFNYQSSPTISYCSFTENTGNYSGGGIYNYTGSFPIISNCQFNGNKAGTFHGGAIMNNSAAASIINCSFAGNTAEDFGGAVYIASSPVTITNCSFSGNKCNYPYGAYGGGVYNYNSSPVITNCILWGDSPNEIYNQQGTAQVTNSIVQGGYPGVDNTDVDPLFSDTSAGNLHLQPCSPGIDEGNTLAVTASTDLDGNPRIVNTKVDMGAYESQQARTAAIIYVNPDATGSNDGTSWNNAFTKLQDALINAPLCMNTQIWVARGTYYPDEGNNIVNNDRSASFVLRAGVRLYGGFDGSESKLTQRRQEANTTILSGEIQQDQLETNNSYHVVTGNSINKLTILDGFIIRDGNTDDNGGGLFNDNASPIITNCIFTNNGANTGAGIYNYFSSPSISNCVFFGNKASNGAGVFNQNALPAFTNCSFAGNIASTDGGGILNNQSSPKIANCVLWGNVPNPVLNINSTPVVSYSIVQGGYPGGTNIWDQDPLFGNLNGGDLHLRCGSPAIDSGSNGALSQWISTDLQGLPRIYNNRVDLGAYEFQSNFYVKADAIGTNNGSSWANAFTSLQDALAGTDSCAGVTQIWVASGFYYPDEGTGLTDNDRNASFHLKKGVAVYGGFAGTENQFSQRNFTQNIAILSGDIDRDQTPSGNAYHVIRCDSVDHTAVLDGLTIGNGNANGAAEEDKQGGGMQIISSNPRIYNCVLILNQAKFGGAVYNTFSNPSFNRCSFTQNMADTGGALYNASLSQFDILSCSFMGNSATNGGAIYNHRQTSLQIKNALFSKNTAFGTNSGTYKGGAIYNASAYVRITNCTFNANSASPGYGGAIYNEGSSPDISNTLLWGNSSEVDNDANSSPVVSYSLVQGGYTGGTNIIDQDPQFVNAALGDLHLRGCSPAIDAGTAQGSYFADLDGYPRPMFNGVDIGAYEFQPNGAGSIVYVKADATGSNDGSSWQNAFTHLQDALSRAGSCKALEIWVATGTYYPTDNSTERGASFVLRNNVKILGGFTGTESPEGPQIRRTDKSILSGDIDRDGSLAGNAYHVVRGVDNDLTAVLDGFIITGGNADGETTPDNTGAGIYLIDASPTITWCTITANTAGNDGGGMYNDHSSPTVSRCIITSNKAGVHGGGIYNYYSSPAITNALFWKDTAAYGGALYNYYGSSPRVFNCTFVYNGYSQYGGGMFNNNQANPVITNCIFWGNSSQIYKAALSAPVVSHCIVQGGYPSGSFILDQDPLFVNAANGDFHLQKATPANNTGTAEGAPDVDLDGNLRSRVAVDLGAYEFGSTNIPGPYDPLQLVCPQSFTLNTDANGCGATVDFTGDHAATSSGGKAPVTITYAPASGTLLPIGVNIITVTVTDDTDHTKTCSFTITVVDISSPVISNLSVDRSVLYPPNHKMQEVQVNYNISDNCPGVTTTLSVSSNEPQYGSGSGDAGPDWQVINDHKLKLRSERSGNGSDRVYTITLTATDASGNTSTANTTVTVPHDNRPTVTMSQPASNKPESNKEESSLLVSVVPNPSSEGFTLYTQTPSTLPLSIRVMDGAGRIVESRRGVVANGTIYIGNNYRPGVYYVQVMQGDVMQTIKLVKQNR